MKNCKVVIENKDGSVCIEKSKQRYSQEEFKKIQALMPAYGWILIARPKLEEIRNQAYTPWQDDED
jgi:hypothetical protein